MRQKQPWEIQEEELVAKETAYLNEFNWFQKLMDNHWYFLIVLVASAPFWMLIGLLIGLLMVK